MSKSSEEDKDVVIGIDLGTTYSAVGVWDNTKGSVYIIPNEEGSNTTPSWVSFSEGEIVVGQVAKDNHSIYPEATIYGVKRLMGKRYEDESVQVDLQDGSYTYKIRGDNFSNIYICIPEYKDFTPEEISAQILMKMKYTAERYLGHPVKKAVITVPAYFNDAERSATKNAAIIAGLDCMRIINEPTAACLCYGLDKKREFSKVLIYDLGGGTFDVSILEIIHGAINVLSTNGDKHLGGEDFCKRVIDFLIEKFEAKYHENVVLSGENLCKLKEVAEKAKRQLSQTKVTKVSFSLQDENGSCKSFSTTLTRTIFEDLCRDLFDSTLEPIRVALEDAELQREDIDEVIMVGGSTRIPHIQDLVSQYFNGKTLNNSINPDECVAYGASVQAAILGKTDTTTKTDEMVLVDVIPLSLGVKTQNGKMTKIIRKNSSVPVSLTMTFTTITDNQESTLIEIYEGERDFVKDNHLLGNFELCGIQKALKGIPKIDITYSVDENGILTVSAIDKSTLSNMKVIVQSQNKLTNEDIARMIDDAEKFKAQDELLKESIEYTELFHNYLDNCLRDVNNPEYSDALSDDDRMYVNQLILNNKSWLDSANQSRVLLEETLANVKHMLSDYINKVYARKIINETKKDKEIDMDEINKDLEERFGKNDK